mmetsp:Transcript_12128/g.18280  ORF Transcript_12128/g.18280 Transcript_12128/m.18280 type:complete len:250 (+) Transcript_12128:395-1144(+)
MRVTKQPANTRGCTGSHRPCVHMVRSAHQTKKSHSRKKNYDSNHSFTKKAADSATHFTLPLLGRPHVVPDGLRSRSPVVSTVALIGCASHGLVVLRFLPPNIQRRIHRRRLPHLHRPLGSELMLACALPQHLPSPELASKPPGCLQIQWTVARAFQTPSCNPQRQACRWPPRGSPAGQGCSWRQTDERTSPSRAELAACSTAAARGGAGPCTAGCRRRHPNLPRRLTRRELFAPRRQAAGVVRAGRGVR